MLSLGEIMTARGLVATAIAILVSVPCFAKPEVVDDGLPSAIVLCYHIVESPQDERMEVSRETFRQHLRYLEMTGYNVIPLRDLYEFVAGKRASIPKNAVVITIDDGWSSAYTEAWPELRERNFPFTLFIYPKIIGKTTIALSWSRTGSTVDGLPRLTWALATTGSASCSPTARSLDISYHSTPPFPFVVPGSFVRPEACPPS